MDRKRKLLVAKIGVISAALPFLIWAHEYGPDAGYSGVPREFGDCTALGCHVGTANNPVNKGSMAVNFPNGNTYTPGVKQRLSVTIADPVQHAWGFQLTARQSSKTTAMAGSFASVDATTGVLCASAINPSDELLPLLTQGQSQTCPATKTLAYIEHTMEGYTATKGPNSATYQFDWTPPATDVGNITIYVAGNAANGDLTSNGDHIYTTTYTLTPAAAGGSAPAILAGGVISASDYGAFTSLAPGTWIEIYGTNLSAGSRLWAGSDFQGVNAPTSLDKVKVTIDGQDAFVLYISPGSVNAQVPSTVKTGTVPLTVTNASGTSATYNASVNAVQPGLLAPAAFKISGKQYVVAQFLDGSFVLPPHSIAGATTRQAKPGETIVIYGIGFGPVVTSSNLNIPAGQIVQQSNQLTNPMKMQFGSAAPVSPDYAGLAPNFVGLYQFNVKVPSVPDNDAVPLTFTLGGAAGSQTLFTAVHQ